MKLLYISSILLLTVLYSQAQTNTCSGIFTTTASVCQAIQVGNGTAGNIRICLTTNSIPVSGNCRPGGSCNPPYSGGGWSPRIAIYESTGSGSTGAAVQNWTATTNAGTCFTVSASSGFAYIYGLCLTAGTVITWTTVNACGDQVCSGTPPPCTGPVCTTCAGSCAACGFTTAPTVNQVTSACPNYPFTPAIATGQTATRCASFTAINTTVDFNVIISSTCGSGNVSSFTWTLQRSNCGTVLQSGTLSNLRFTGLTIGQQYVYCYTFTVPNPGPPTNSCTHTTHYPYFVGAAQLLDNELLSFTAKKVDRKNLLEWTNANQESNFEVERSKDGIIFEKIGSVSFSESISDEENNNRYSFSDNNPLPEAYYRIKSIDKMDGFAEFSSIRFLSRSDVGFTESLNLVSMYPIPATDSDVNIEIQAEESQSTSFKIYNSNGTLVKSFTQNLSKGLNSITIPTESLPKGIYTISIEDKQGKNKIIKKFVI